MARVNLNDFPKLEIRSNDVYGSWRSWLTEFELCIELTTMNMGVQRIREGDQERVVDVFRGRRKLVALLGAIGKEGRETLQSVGFDFQVVDATYEQALQRLTEIYGVEETVYVKTMKFVTATQAAGENETDYLLRVANLSRKLNFGNNDAQRQEFALAIAVNGLREPSLRTKLMERADLNWERLTDTLRTRSIARQSETVLEGARAGLHNVKQEVAAIASSDSRSVNKGSSSGKHRKSSKSRGRHSTEESDSETEVNRVSSHRSKRYTKEKRHKTSRRSPSRSSRSSRGSSVDSDRGKRDSKYKKDKKSSSKKSDKCYGCGIRGHEIRYCPDVRCFYCDRKGHTQKDCRKFKERYGNRTSDSDTSRGSSGRSPSRRVRYAESSKPS